MCFKLNLGRFTVCCEVRGFKPGTAAIQSGALSLGNLNFPMIGDTRNMWSYFLIRNLQKGVKIFRKQQTKGCPQKGT
jgi:hypothetical protein